MPGCFQPEISSFRLHLAAEGKAAKTVSLRYVDLLAVQDRFDNHFLDSPEWRAARS